MFKLSKPSLLKLKGVSPALVEVVKRAIQISEVDFGVSEGVRTPERQKELYEAGKSLTLASRHLTGEAVDLFAWVDNYVNWNFHFYEKIAQAMKLAASELNTEIEWGGDWKTFKDGVHFQLKRNKE